MYISDAKSFQTNLGPSIVNATDGDMTVHISKNGRRVIGFTIKPMQIVNAVGVRKKDLSYYKIIVSGENYESEFSYIIMKKSEEAPRKLVRQMWLFDGNNGCILSKNEFDELKVKSCDNVNYAN